VRSLTTTWDDPHKISSALLNQPGIDFMRAVQRGEIPAPPVARLLQFDSILEVAEGRVVFEYHPNESQYNPMGTVHGGASSGVIDAAMGCAVITTLKQGEAFTTLDLQLRYFRPITEKTGALQCAGVILQRGKTYATAEARLTGDGGKLYIHATSTCAIILVTHL
jgi:uncharacterized protein (TIGR00369 family)